MIFDGDFVRRFPESRVTISLRPTERGKAISLCSIYLDGVQGGQVVGHLGQQGYMAAGANLHHDNFKIPHQ
jgi:hypothetical protein